MRDEKHLDRFLSAHAANYASAFNEIKNGRKQTHWMWYIFPQIEGLGYSETSKFYAIKDLDEAEQFLNHPVLGKNLVNICNQLLLLKETSANKIFGSPDNMKLRSSMTLFSLVPQTDPVFKKVLDKFFSDDQDLKTLYLISQIPNKSKTITNKQSY